MRERLPRIGSSPIQSRQTIYIVEVNRATAIVKLAHLIDLRIGYKPATLARLANALAHVAPARSEMNGYDDAVALDRVVATDDGGRRPTYGVKVDASNLLVVAGLITGNCFGNL